MNKGLIYELIILASSIVLGYFTIGLLPALIIGVILGSVIGGYTSEEDMEGTVVKTMFISSFSGLLLLPSLLPTIGGILLLCFLGGFGSLTGYHFNPFRPVSVSQPAG